MADAGYGGDDIDYVVTMKFDGLTVSLTYQDGVLINGATRGTGEVGEGAREGLTSAQIRADRHGVSGTGMTEG